MIWHLFASRNNLSVRKSSKTWEKMGFCVSPKMVSDPPLCKWISRKAKKTYSIAVIGYFDDFKQFGEQTVQSSSQCTWNCAILCLFKRENCLLCAWRPDFLRAGARYDCKWSICFSKLLRSFWHLIGQKPMNRWWVRVFSDNPDFSPFKRAFEPKNRCFSNCTQR